MFGSKKYHISLVDPTKSVYKMRPTFGTRVRSFAPFALILGLIAALIAYVDGDAEDTENTDTVTNIEDETVL